MGSVCSRISLTVQEHERKQKGMCRDTRDHPSDAEADPDKRQRKEPGRHTDRPRGVM